MVNKNNLNLKLENIINDFNNKLNDKIDNNIINEINNKINNKYNELKDIINEFYSYNEYIVCL